MTAPDYLDRDHYSCLVVGSGFGGAVSACRLAQAGIDVALVERGRRLSPGTFPRDLTRLSAGWSRPDGHGLYDFRSTSDVVCWCAPTSPCGDAFGIRNILAAPVPPSS